LQKRGINGPSQCALCQEVEESIQHIFIDCKFTKETWIHILGTLHQCLIWLDTFMDFTKWKRHYIGNLKGKTILLRCWESLPKYLCWGIWLARNKTIFDNTTNTPRQVTLKASTLLSAYTRQRVQWKSQPLDSNKELWIK
jgi:hypothetical protein